MRNRKAEQKLMAIKGAGSHRNYVLKVGQADTSVVITPRGRVLVIDAVQPAKLVRLLKDLGIAAGMSIELMVITHPHNDHFSGANRLVREFDVKEAIFAPFWHDYSSAPPTYCQLIATLFNKGAVCHFLSGYSRWYPDGALVSSSANDNRINPSAPFFELIGPANSLIKSLQRERASTQLIDRC